jgi:hypothetical protein
MLTMTQIEEGFAELRAGFAEMRSGLAELRHEMHTALDGVRLAMIDGFQRMRDDLRAEFGGLVEAVRDDVRAIADGHLALDERMERIEHGQQVLKREVSFMRMDLYVVKKDVSGLKKTTAGLKKTTAGLKKTTAKLVTQMGRVYRHLELNGGAKRTRVRGRRA